MSLVGNLEDFRLFDLLQILSRSSNTGKLSLTRSDRQGVIVFRNGRVIYAASTSVRDTLGSILISRQLVTEKELKRALEEQHRSSDEKRLGNVLVAMGLISGEDLADVVKWQVARVIGEFMTWQSAYFKFEPLEIADNGEIEVDLEDFLIDEGLSTDRLVLSLVDEDGEATDLADLAEAAAKGRKRLTSLAVIMGEINPPELTGELVARIVEVGEGTVRRGVLFTRRQQSFGCRAHFGLGIIGLEVDGLTLPAEEPSILRLVAETMETYRGPLVASPVNELLVEQLGGGAPREILAIPMVVGRHVGAVFYGDNLPGNEEIGPSDELEVLMIESSLAMEQAVIDKRRSYLNRAKKRRMAPVPGE